MHFIPGSWCTPLLRRTCRRCLNLLPSFPSLGHNNSQKHGRNTGRLRRKPPRQADRHTHKISLCAWANYLWIPRLYLNTYSHSLSKKDFYVWLLSIKRTYNIQTKQAGTSSSCTPSLSFIQCLWIDRLHFHCTAVICGDWVKSLLHLSLFWLLQGHVNSPKKLASSWHRLSRLTGWLTNKLAWGTIWLMG